MKNRISLYLAIPLFCGIYLVILIASFSTSTHAEPLSPWGTVPPDLKVSLNVVPDEIKNGEPVTFTLDLVNQGGTSAEAITLTAYLPLPYMEVLGCQTASGESCQLQEMGYVSHFASLGVNQHKVMTVRAKARSNYAHITRTFARGQVASSSYDSDLLSNEAHILLRLDNPVDLAVTHQVDRPDVLLPGDPVTVTINVNNLESNPLFLQQQQHFRNPATIFLPDTTLHQLQPALTYPSVITVSGVTKPVVGVEVTFFAISRTWTEDMDILLVGPTGVSVTLLSDVGGATELGAIDLTFSDSAEKDATNQDVIPQGVYRPTNFARKDESLYDTYPAPGPGDVLDPVPYLGRFNGLNPNGAWKLYIIDDQPNDTGEIINGWGITFTTKSTNNIPLHLEHIAPDLNVLNPITAPGWNVTRTAQGFEATTISANGATPGPITLHATTPITPGVHPFTSTLQAVPGDENMENNLAQTDLSVASLSDIGLTAQVAPAKALYGDQVTYVITVTNHGPTFAPSVKLNIHVADALSVIDVTPTQGDCSVSGAKVTCNSGDLPMVDGLNQMVITILADTPGGGLPGPYSIFTTVAIESLEDPVPANNSLTISSRLGSVNVEPIYLPLITR